MCKRKENKNCSRIAITKGNKIGKSCQTTTQAAITSTMKWQSKKDKNYLGPVLKAPIKPRDPLPILLLCVWVCLIHWLYRYKDIESRFCSSSRVSSSNNKCQWTPPKSPLRFACSPWSSSKVHWRRDQVAKKTERKHHNNNKSKTTFVSFHFSCSATWRMGNMVVLACRERKQAT